jgi:hypothetical protein
MRGEIIRILLVKVNMIQGTSAKETFGTQNSHSQIFGKEATGLLTVMIM